MPQLLESIDEIACRLKRDVLMLTFCNQSPSEMEGLFIDDDIDSDAWKTDPGRAEIVAWLMDRGIPHQQCFGIWSMGLSSAPYRGFLFVDVRYDTSAADYRELAAFIEDENGMPRLPGVGFYVFVHKPATFCDG